MKIILKKQQIVRMQIFFKFLINLNTLNIMQNNQHIQKQSKIGKLDATKYKLILLKNITSIISYYNMLGK